MNQDCSEMSTLFVIYLFYVLLIFGAFNFDGSYFSDLTSFESVTFIEFGCRLILELSDDSINDALEMSDLLVLPVFECQGHFQVPFHHLHLLLQLILLLDQF